MGEKLRNTHYYLTAISSVIALEEPRALLAFRLGELVDGKFWRLGYELWETKLFKYGIFEFLARVFDHHPMGLKLVLFHELFTKYLWALNLSFAAVFLVFGSFVLMVRQLVLAAIFLHELLCIIDLSIFNQIYGLFTLKLAIVFNLLLGYNWVAANRCFGVILSFHAILLEEALRLMRHPLAPQLFD